MCTVLLPPGVNPIAVDKYIITGIEPWPPRWNTGNYLPEPLHGLQRRKSEGSPLMGSGLLEAGSRLLNVVLESSIVNTL